MAKSFGKKRIPSPQELQQLQKFIDTRNLEYLEALCEELVYIYGLEAIATSLIEILLSSSSIESNQWIFRHVVRPEYYHKWGNQTMMLLSYLMLKQPPDFESDFAEAEKKVLLTEKAQRELLEQVTSKHLGKLQQLFDCRKQHFSISSHPAKLLEHRVGVPFFDNLLELINEQAQLLPVQKAAYLIVYVSCGIEKKYPAIPVFHWLIANLDHALQSPIVDLVRSKNISEYREMNSLGFELILKAAGRKLFTIDVGDNLIISSVTQDDIKIFNLIWEYSENSSKELMADLEKWSRDLPPTEF